MRVAYMKKVIAILIFVAFIATITWMNFSLDGLVGLIYGTFFKDDDTTEYASGYSDKAFRRLSRGMSSNDVKTLLGEPFRRWDIVSRKELFGSQFAENETWVYSRSTHDGSFRIRSVQFCNGRVEKVYSEYYID